MGGMHAGNGARDGGAQVKERLLPVRIVWAVLTPYEMGEGVAMLGVIEAYQEFERHSPGTRSQTGSLPYPKMTVGIGTYA